MCCGERGSGAGGKAQEMFLQAGSHRSPLRTLQLYGPMLRGCQQSQAECRPHRSQGLFHTRVTTRWYKAFNSYFFTPLDDIICLTPEPSGKAGRHTACCLDALLSSAVLVWKIKCHSPHHRDCLVPGAGASLQLHSRTPAQPTSAAALGPSGNLAWETGTLWPGLIRVVILVRFGLVWLIFQVRGLQSLRPCLWIGET